MTKDYSELIMRMSKLQTDVKDALIAIVTEYNKLEVEHFMQKELVDKQAEIIDELRAEVMRLRHKLDDAMERRG